VPPRCAYPVPRRFTSMRPTTLPEDPVKLRLIPSATRTPLYASSFFPFVVKITESPQLTPNRPSQGPNHRSSSAAHTFPFLPLFAGPRSLLRCSAPSCPVAFFTSGAHVAPNPMMAPPSRPRASRFPSLVLPCRRVNRFGFPSPANLFH